MLLRYASVLLLLMVSFCLIVIQNVSGLSLSLPDYAFISCFVAGVCRLLFVSYEYALVARNGGSVSFRYPAILPMLGFGSVVLAFSACYMLLPHVIETLPQYGWWFVYVTLIVGFLLKHIKGIKGSLSSLDLMIGGVSVSLSLSLCVCSFPYLVDGFVTFLGEC